jgi:elongation factor Ts
MVKQLRELTGAGVLDCKKALDQTNGDFDKAAALLREKGLAAAAKKATREAKEGLIGSYVHMGAKVAALVEVNCETDFVARTEQFQALVKDLAMHVVASRPRYVRREDIPAAELEEERAKFMAQVADSGKPAEVLAKIVDGKLEKYYEDNCLMEQPFIKDPNATIADVITQAIAKLGENIVVRRFSRLEIGA